MAQAIFDTAEKLNLYFRIARVGSKAFTFVDANEDDFDLSGLTFQLNIKSHSGSSSNILQLTSGSGLSVSGNVLTVSVTEEQTDISENLYYWELYEAVDKKTWLCGNAYFMRGTPNDLNDSTSVTVNINPDTVMITISNVTTITEVDGGTI